MNITLVYLSQTGNTRKVAETMAEAFRNLGHSPRLVPLRRASREDAATCDLLGIGTPCFVSRAPAPVKDYLRALPEMQGRPAFAFATSGGAPGRVLTDLGWHLQQRGARVAGGFLARGEIHYPAPCLIGRFPNRPNADDLAQADRFAVSVAEHVAQEQAGIIAASRAEVSQPGHGFYDLVGLAMGDALVRRLLPAPRLDAPLCDHCQWCERSCPTGNLTLAPDPVVGPQCIRCYRCLACPQGALKVDWAVPNAVVWSLYNKQLERWFGDIQPGEPMY